MDSHHHGAMFDSLYSFINTESVLALNELEKGMGKRCVKPYDLRKDKTGE